MRLEDGVGIVTGGTDPGDSVHDVVVEAMREVGIDLSGRTPREVTPDGLADCDIVVTMGCSAGEVCPAGWGGENRVWNLHDPRGKEIKEVREIRDEIDRRVGALFDELVA